MANYYVSPTGSDSNSGSLTTIPWLTLNKVCSSSFSAGDTISFKCSGSWYEGGKTFSSNGTLANPITITSYDTGDDPIFLGRFAIYGASYKWTATGSNNEYYLEAAAGGTPGISQPKQIQVGSDQQRWPLNGSVGSLNNHEWAWASTGVFNTVYLRSDSGDPDTLGLEIWAITQTRFITVSGDHVVLDSLCFDSSDKEALYITGSSVTVQYSEMRYCGAGVKSEEDYTTVTHNNIHDGRLWISDSTAYNDVGAYGVEVHSNHTEISYNTIQNMQEFSYDFSHDGSAIEVYASAAGIDTLLFHHNYVYRCDNLSEIAATSGTNANITNLYFYYNIIIQGKCLSLHNGGTDTEKATISNVKFWQNTYLDDRDYTTDFGGWLVNVFSWYVAPSAGQLEYKNNIFYVGQFYYILKDNVDNTNVVHTNNIWYRANGSSTKYCFNDGTATGDRGTLDATEADKDPAWVDRVGRNLHLTTSSCAVNSGSTLAISPYVDYDGIAVPQGTYPDMGAYEYYVSASAVTWHGLMLLGVG